MLLRPLTVADRPLLREATLANMNWSGPRFTVDDVDATPALSHYFTGFPGGGDFGFAARVDGTKTGVAWAVLLPAADPGYGYVDAETPELSLTTFDPYRGRGVGTALLDALIQEARRRWLPALSLSVEDADAARRLYERAGFEVVGRNGESDTMLHALTRCGQAVRRSATRLARSNFGAATAGTSNGPTEAINGRLEYLPGSALGFRSLNCYLALSLLETGRFGPLLHFPLRLGRVS